MKAGRLVFAAVALFAIHDDADSQLVLLDETVFTIGANTDLTVDEVNLAGTFSVNIVVDFGSQIFCPGGCINAISINVPGGISDSTNINQGDYLNEVGFVSGSFEPSDLSNPNFRGTFAAILNTGGIIANQAFIFINYIDSSSGDAGTGSGTSQPR